LEKFLSSFSIIIFSFLFGYGLQILVQQGRLVLTISLDELRKLFQKIALLYLNPVAIVCAIWVANIQDIRLAALPFICLFALFAGGVLALVAARCLGLEPRKTGVMFVCGSFTNVGVIGALICFVFFGEIGFALVAIYRLFEELFCYAVGFPVAKYYSSRDNEEQVTMRVKGLARDPFIIIALASIILGGIFNYSGATRPLVFQTIVAVCVLLVTFLLLASIGMGLKFKHTHGYIKECVAISVIKFIIVPLLATSMGYIIGYNAIDNGLPLKVVLILSAMPVAFIALIPASLYDLDLDLANACWFFTTAMLAVELPIILILLNFFP
jgi:predicted permease